MGTVGTEGELAKSGPTRELQCRQGRFHFILWELFARQVFPSWGNQETAPIQEFDALSLLSLLDIRGAAVDARLTRLAHKSASKTNFRTRATRRGRTLLLFKCPGWWVGWVHLLRVWVAALVASLRHRVDLVVVLDVISW